MLPGAGPFPTVHPALAPDAGVLVDGARSQRPQEWGTHVGSTPCGFKCERPPWASLWKRATLLFFLLFFKKNFKF